MGAFVYCWRCWWGSLLDFVSPFWRSKLINPRRKTNKQWNEGSISNFFTKNSLLSSSVSLISSPIILFCHHQFGQPNFDWSLNEPTLLGRLTTTPYCFLFNEDLVLSLTHSQTNKLNMIMGSTDISCKYMFQIYV